MEPTSTGPSIPEVTSLLSTNPLFASTPPDVIAQIVDAMEILPIPNGATLFRQGDDGDSLYLILRGQFALSSDSNSATAFTTTLGPGEILGELALLTSHPRAATAIAERDSFVAQLTRSQFERIAALHPDAMAALIAAFTARLHTYQLNAAIQASVLMQKMSPDLRAAFASQLQVESIAGGTILCRAGDPGETLYLVLSGRLRVLANPDATTSETPAILAELGKGDIVGETALMTGGPRTATVLAVRDSLIASLDREAFRQLIAQFPLEIVALFTTQLVARYSHPDRSPASGPPTSIAIITLSKSVDSTGFSGRLKTALETFGEVLHLYRDTPIVRNYTSPAAEARLVEWLNEQESRFRHVLYEASPEPSPWIDRAIRQADRIFLVIDATSDSTAKFKAFASQFADLLENRIPRNTGAAIELILIQPADEDVPTDTAQFLAAFPAAVGHHHVRMELQDDFARLARFINGRQVGLTLGGGFALGIAHVGVIRALRELKVPIDCVGGTSMGAVLAAGCARGLEYEPLLDAIVNGCAAGLKGDYTLPVLSVLTGTKLAHELGAFLAHLNIEDYWIPYFAISVSLRRSRMVVHRKGDALRAVLASCRAPGMLPPLAWDGDLLIDGGVVNNLPTDIMRGLAPNGTVIAVDVSPSQAMIAGPEDGLAVSGWRTGLDRWLSRPTPRPTLTLLEVLGRMVRLGGTERAGHVHAETDWYLTPPLAGVKALDFHRGRELAENSYHYTLEAFATWTQQHGTPWQ
jgi:NTE family protein